MKKNGDAPSDACGGGTGAELIRGEKKDSNRFWADRKEEGKEKVCS